MNHSVGLSVILVSPKTAGNVGAAARAMLNMGASDLRLVSPRCDHLESGAVAMAVHAEEVLREARVFSSLREALTDRDLSIGTTARGRGDLPDPVHPAQIRSIFGAAQAAAIVFGPEESGLSNDDLELCQLSIRIPTAEYASLNLAQAVLLACYELLQQLPCDNTTPVVMPTAVSSSRLATRAEMEGLYDHLEQVMHLTGYTDAVRARHTLRLWRAMLDRSLMSSAESRLFRGLLRQVNWKVAQGQAHSEEHPKE